MVFSHAIKAQGRGWVKRRLLALALLVTLAGCVPPENFITTAGGSSSGDSGGQGGIFSENPNP